MMKKVGVWGSAGNMGKRYCKILEQYGCEVVRIDLGTRGIIENLELLNIDGFIIATPTKTHLDILEFLIPFKKPMLCEKPITKHILELQRILSFENIDLSMINQYEFLEDKSSEGHTEYDYFKTGQDDLIWDCINIIGLARSSYDIKDNSLIWNCSINGKKLSISDMDRAYIENIMAWVEGKWRNKSYILPAHAKIITHINRYIHQC